MNLQPRLISRIALFSALIYVLSYATAYLPNVSFVFFIVFAGGYLWGALAGSMIGLIGMWLSSSFNPFGPAALPLLVAQMIGAGCGGLVGAFVHGRSDHGRIPPGMMWLILAAVVCTLAYYLPVNGVDAWLYQPFWPRFISGLPWVAISMVSNALIFPLLFGVVTRLYARESRFR
ncbi:MAG: ECF transporter S component [candidate division Zixibacteria bacterium]|nr:ECF transporter S component [candidate division Zixibacteria bacterium]MDH3939010.1 ECF transporter S component [candidate division Zixibacteria bacterium]MDH4033257.1 ECF transporter S component [candidate division Zixibacteria bacterium]